MVIFFFCVEHDADVDRCLLTSVSIILRVLDNSGWIVRHFYKGNYSCDFLFAILHNKSLLKRGGVYM